MVTAAPFEVAIQVETTQKVHGWMNRMGSIHTVEYDSAMQRSEALTQATMWMDPEHMMLSERSRHRRTQCVIPLIGNVQNRQIHRHRKHFRGYQQLGGRGMGTAHGHGVSLGCRKCLETEVMSHNLVNVLNATELSIPPTASEHRVQGLRQSLGCWRVEGTKVGMSE